MRQVVVMDDVREVELWPSKLFDKYLDLTKKDVEKIFLNNDEFRYVDCPACGTKNEKESFKKFGMIYKECKKCKTLYVSPRPSEEKIFYYYKNSKAVDFWYSEIIKKTLKNRSTHQSVPRAMWITNIMDELFDKPETFLSINTISQSLLREINNVNVFKKKLLYKPYINISKSFLKTGGFEIIKNDELHDVNANAVSALGLIDRVYSPKQLIEIAYSSLGKNGVFFITGSSISGFDLQILWDKAKSIFPPDRINLLSIEGIIMLFENNGFEIIELSTPGQLDVELVKDAIKNEKNISVPRFISYMLEKRDENSHRYFQDFLQRFKLSSHFRIAAKKIK